MNKLRKETKLAGMTGIVILILVIAVIVIGNASEKQDIYREDMVKRGDLVAGTSESGSVAFGIKQQVFEAEPEYAEALIVEQVCVSEGQTIKAGDTLYLLDENKVAKLRNELESSLEKAQKELDVVNAERDSAEQNAQFSYDSSIAYGMYAEAEYNNTVRSLETAVTDASEKLADAKSVLSIYQEQLRAVNADYTTAGNVLKRCEESRDKIDRTKELYKYVESFELAKEAQSNLDALAEKKEQLEQEVQLAQENVDSYTEQVKIAQRNLNSERLDAQETLEFRKLAYDTAQKTYDVTMEYWEENAGKQENAYAQAKDRWEKFNFYIDGNTLKAYDNGVVDAVCLAIGDSIGSNDILVTLYNMDEVTMTVTMSEEDVQEITVGTSAQVSFQAYPDKTFEAVVVGVSDAQAVAVSDGDAPQHDFDVTVALQGDVSGLFQGMTGEVTFINKAVRDVLYVSNHAVRREGAQAYVQVMDADGNMLEKQVITGFSDGVNVEITEGLSEGDVVCYTLKEESTDIETKKAGRIKVEQGQQLVYARVTGVRGNEITYLVTQEDGNSVTAGDAFNAEITEESVTTLIPVGVITDFSKLEAGQKLGLVIEQTAEEQVITGLYLIK